jgi:hypothetical protein
VSSARLALLLVAVALSAAACADGNELPAPLGERNPPPPLATDPPADGEIVFRGLLSPRTHRPVPLRGRYVARFAQWAPEDAQRDFAAETSFVASLEGVSGAARGESLPLFEASAASGRRRVRLNGRYVLDVAFGDFPYVVRLTPIG